MAKGKKSFANTTLSVFDHIAGDVATKNTDSLPGNEDHPVETTSTKENAPISEETSLDIQKILYGEYKNVSVEKKTERLQIVLQPTTLIKLKAFTEKKNISMNSFIHDLIETALKQAVEDGSLTKEDIEEQLKQKHLPKKRGARKKK